MKSVAKKHNGNYVAVDRRSAVARVVSDDREITQLRQVASGIDDDKLQFLRGEATG